MKQYVEPESGVTMLDIIVGNCEQYGQQNIVQSCLQQYCNKLFVFRCVVGDWSLVMSYYITMYDVRASIWL